MTFEVAEGWGCIEFSELFEIPLRNGIYKKKEFHGSGINIINMGELFSYPRFQGDVDLRRLELSNVELEKNSLKEDDLIFARRSLTAEGAGKCSIIKKLSEPAVFESSIIRVRLNRSLVVPDFYYYFFNSVHGKELLGTILRQVAVAGITGTDLSKLVVPVPPVEKQADIAKVLSILDDKIFLNTQINQTLEQMAQTLFKSWFVDFDPVIDNALEAGNTIPEPLAERAARRQAMWAAGNESAPARLPAETRRLFPDRFEEDDVLGWVPVGWVVKPVGDVVEIVGGGTPKTSTPEFWEGGHHAFCTPKDMSNLDSKILLQTERHLTNAGVRKVSSGQLPVGTVLMSSRAPIGYLAIGKIPVSINQGIIALKPHGVFGSEFLLFWLGANRDQVESRANGSTFLEISKKNFRNIPFLIPPDDVCTEFGKQAKSYMNASTSFKKQMVSLTKLRDTLLPKLLSGELQLPEADTVIQTALEIEPA
ncbi:hypothetical protein FF32_05095 [Halomonas campaniensis]|nr:hypothetical protein FF32_05095 [Halomonas campaniensis]